MKNKATLLAVLSTFAVLLGGCLKDDGDNSEYPDVKASYDTVSGTLKYREALTSGGNIVAWPFGTATFKVIAGDNDVLASADVNADGSFTLILPETVKGKYLSAMADAASMQGGTVKAVPETVRLLSILQYKVEYSKNGQPASILTNLYTLNEDNTIIKSYFFNFYDSAGSFAGTGLAGNVFDWTFQKGWGKTESAVLNSTLRTFISKSVNEFPAEAVWVNY